ncbi:MAG: hypothetical protein K2N80_10615, partial [Lachnospiraceae bacterium]|nr:hypothetical protein [Lachnospiraceae bacterium]
QGGDVTRTNHIAPYYGLSISRQPLFLQPKSKIRLHSSESGPLRTFVKKQTTNDTEKNAMYSQTEKIRMFSDKLF